MAARGAINGVRFLLYLSYLYVATPESFTVLKHPCFPGLALVYSFNIYNTDKCCISLYCKIFVIAFYTFYFFLLSVCRKAVLSIKNYLFLFSLILLPTLFFSESESGSSWVLAMGCHESKKIRDIISVLATWEKHYQRDGGCLPSSK